MSKEVLMLVDVLAKEKNLDKEIVFDSLEKALAFATKRSFDREFPVWKCGEKWGRSRHHRETERRKINALECVVERRKSHRF